MHSCYERYKYLFFISIASLRRIISKRKRWCDHFCGILGLQIIHAVVLPPTRAALLSWLSKEFFQFSIINFHIILFKINPKQFYLSGWWTEKREKSQTRAGYVQRGGKWRRRVWRRRLHRRRGWPADRRQTPEKKTCFFRLVRKNIHNHTIISDFEYICTFLKTI